MKKDLFSDKYLYKFFLNYSESRLPFSKERLDLFLKNNKKRFTAIYRIHRGCTMDYRLIEFVIKDIIDISWNPGKIIPVVMQILGDDDDNRSFSGSGRGYFHYKM
jgi:hypothetical protein